MAHTKLAHGGVKDLMRALSRPGPHPVLRGDLALAGLPGVVMTPAEGWGLPAVAFGHGWMQPTSRYLGTLKHLASWGIVAAAPATQRGPVPSHLQLAADLRTTLDICAHVRLGPGEISVQPERLALAGHGMGAGAAVLAAAQDARIKALVAFAPASTSPSAVTAASSCTMPALFMAAPADDTVPAQGHAESLARTWGGAAVLRTVQKSSDLGLAEGWHWSNHLFDGGPERKTQRVVRALFTAFLLRHLTDDRSYEQLTSAESDIPHTELVDPLPD
ncbi:MAG: poly(ethylene terephthalate) hydrolase family protein [Mycobacteriaceae bacterium]